MSSINRIHIFTPIPAEIQLEMKHDLLHKLPWTVETFCIKHKYFTVTPGRHNRPEVIESSPSQLQEEPDLLVQQLLLLLVLGEPDELRRSEPLAQIHPDVAESHLEQHKESPTPVHLHPSLPGTGSPHSPLPSWRYSSPCSP